MTQPENHDYISSLVYIEKHVPTTQTERQTCFSDNKPTFKVTQSLLKKLTTLVLNGPFTKDTVKFKSICVVLNNVRREMLSSVTIVFYDKV